MEMWWRRLSVSCFNFLNREYFAVLRGVHIWSTRYSEEFPRPGMSKAIDSPQIMRRKSGIFISGVQWHVRMQKWFFRISSTPCPIIESSLGGSNKWRQHRNLWRYESNWWWLRLPYYFTRNFIFKQFFQGTIFCTVSFWSRVDSRLRIFILLLFQVLFLSSS